MSLGIAESTAGRLQKHAGDDKQAEGDKNALQHLQPSRWRNIITNPVETSASSASAPKIAVNACSTSIID